MSRESYESTQDVVDFKNTDHIVFAGIGGSGALGDIFSAILSKTKIHVAVVKGYHIPSTVDSHTLVVTTSISGNKVETLSVLDSANKSECNVVAFSSGGKLKEYFEINKIDYREIHSVKGCITSKLINLIYLLDYASIYLAVLSKVDPSPTKSIDYIKSKLSL